MEFKNFAIEFKADDSRTIEGLGSVFNNVDHGNDMVMPGAFDKTIKSGRMPAMLWQHKSDQVIGVYDEMKATAEGLYLKGRILETSLGNDVYTLAKGGALKGMSIGYATKDSSLDRKTGVRQLKELELWEVSLVTFPMNEMATITNVKAKPATERELEEYLRDVGYSQKEAKKIVAEGYRAIAGRRDVEGHELEGLFNLLNQTTL